MIDGSGTRCRLGFVPGFAQGADSMMWLPFFRHLLRSCFHFCGSAFHAMTRAGRCLADLASHSAFFFCLLPFLLTGCAGYHVGEAKPAYMKSMHTIFIPVFRNNTLLPQVEGMVTDTVARQFQQDGTYRLTSRDAADALLNCTIERLTRTPERSVTGNVLLTSEFDLSLVVSYQVIDGKTGKVIDAGQANGTTRFFVGNDVTQDERQALPLAAEQLAVRLVSALAEGF